MTSSASPRIAPGPVPRWLSGHLALFRNDALRLVTNAHRKYGEVVRFRLGRSVIHLLNHPDDWELVLHRHSANYDKQTIGSAKIAGVCGESLLTLSGHQHRRQRRLIQPGFTQERLAGFEPVLVEETERMLDRWRSLQGVDVMSEMMALTFTIVGRTLLGAELHADIAAVEKDFGIVLEHTYNRVESVVDLPPRVPTPANVRFRRAMGTLDDVVYRIIAARRATGEAGDDLLGALLRARDEEEQTGGMTDQQLRNETMTLLLAGHETTALALGWTLWLVAKHPAVEQRMLDEIRDVLGDRPPGVGDFPRLVYTTQVFQEAMRLYPPIWIMERRAIERDAIGGYDIPAGSSVVMSQWVVHRREDFWPDPLRFDPERFDPEQMKVRPRFAYAPFGLGPRLCVGMHFAMMEARTILPMVVRAFALSPVKGHRVSPKPGVTLRAATGIPLTITPRTA
jgi:cytochrome P450